MVEKAIAYEGHYAHRVTRNGRPLDPRPSLRIMRHSPTGFSWGYHGSGPAQLALALLYDVTHDVRLAVRYHQRFKGEFVAGWPINGSWSLAAQTIRDWVKERLLRDPDAPLEEAV